MLDFVFLLLNWYQTGKWGLMCQIQSVCSVIHRSGLRGGNRWEVSGCHNSPALTVTALTNCSLQLLLPTTRARLVFLISLSTVLCKWRQRQRKQMRDAFTGGAASQETLMWKQHLSSNRSAPWLRKTDGWEHKALLSPRYKAHYQHKAALNQCRDRASPWNWSFNSQCDIMLQLKCS